MVLGWYFQQSREGVLVMVNSRSDLLCNMLVDEQYCNILAFREFLEGCLDGRHLCFGIYDQEVLLLLFVNVTYASKKKTCDRIFITNGSDEVPVLEGGVGRHAHSSSLEQCELVSITP